jgi:hypothetical protein
LRSLFRSPHVDAGAPGVNFRVVVELPTERWLLWAGGPPQGPAILLWGYLILILAAALLLPLLPYAPLKRTEWLLLGLGLTQVPVALALFVGGWFFAVGSRNAWPIAGRKTKNFLQVLLVLYSVAFVFSLTGSVYEGLVSSPDMEVSGAGSYNTHLVWFSDRTDGAFPKVWDLSVSIWVWRAFMLAWALWLSKSLLTWLRWAWMMMSTGHFWTPEDPAQARARSSLRHPDAPPAPVAQSDDQPDPATMKGSEALIEPEKDSEELTDSDDKIVEVGKPEG